MTEENLNDDLSEASITPEPVSFPPLPPLPPLSAAPEPKPFPGILQSFGLVVLIIILQLAGGVVLGIAAGIYFAVTGQTSGFSAEAFVTMIPPVILVAPVIVTNVLVLFLGLWFTKRPVSETLSFRSAPGVAYLAFIPIILGVIIVLSELDNFSRAYFPLPNIDQDTLRIFLNDVFVGMFYVSLLGPILEEFIFRGLILKGLLKRYSKTTAFWVSALLFMLVHLNPAQFPTALLLGLLLAWIYQKTQSIWPCVFAHVLNNMLAYIYFTYPLPFKIPGFNTLPEEGVIEFQPLWFDGLGVVLVVLGIVLVRTMLPPRDEVFPAAQTEYREGRRTTGVALHVG